MKDRARAFGESGGHALLGEPAERGAEGALPPDGPQLRLHRRLGDASPARRAGRRCRARSTRCSWSRARSRSGRTPATSRCAPEPPGYFHRIVKDGLVRGPIVTTRSSHDTAVGRFYPLGAQVRQQLVLGNDLPAYGGIGTFGIQGQAGAVDMPMRAGDLRLRLPARDRSTTSNRARSSATAAARRARTATSPIPKSRMPSGPRCCRRRHCRRRHAVAGRRWPGRDAVAVARRPARRRRAARHAADAAGADAATAAAVARARSVRSDRGDADDDPPSRCRRKPEPARRARAARAGARPALDTQRMDQRRARGPAARRTARRRQVVHGRPRRRHRPARAKRWRLPRSPKRRSFPPESTRSRSRCSSTAPTSRSPTTSGRCASRAPASRATRRASTSRRCTTAPRRSPRRCTRTATSCSSIVDHLRRRRRAAGAGRDGRARTTALGRARAAAARRRRLDRARASAATTASSGAPSRRARACRCSRPQLASAIDAAARAS